MCSSTVELQMKSRLIYFRNWVQKLFNCKDWKIIKVIASTATASLFLSYLWIFIHQMQHSNCTSLFTSIYISIRYRRFFDIIKSMYSATLKLQIKFLLIYFKSWVQKLFNCKSWKVVFEVARFDDNRVVFSILSIESLFIKKYFFEKISTNILVSINKKKH